MTTTVTDAAGAAVGKGAHRPPADGGYTLIEVLMAMVCTSILLTLVTSAVIEIYHSVNGVDALSAAQSEVDTSFARLDREIRYARAISDPGTVGGDAYVEYLLSADSVDTCVELRLRTATGQLQRRQWVKNAVPPVPAAWQTLASSVSGATPFAVTEPDTESLTGFRYQRLTLNITSVTGGGPNSSAASGRAGARRQTDVTFTALNATAPQNAATCTEARGVSS